MRLPNGGGEIMIEQGGIELQFALIEAADPGALAGERPEVNALRVEGVVEQRHHVLVLLTKVDPTFC